MINSNLQPFFLTVHVFYMYNLFYSIIVKHMKMETMEQYYYTHCSYRIVGKYLINKFYLNINLIHYVKM